MDNSALKIKHERRLTDTVETFLGRTAFVFLEIGLLHAINQTKAGSESMP